jgi:hypothetical protein
MGPPVRVSFSIKPFLIRFIEQQSLYNMQKIVCDLWNISKVPIAENVYTSVQHDDLAA